MTAPITSREELPTDEVTLADFIYSVRSYDEATAKAKLLWPMLSVAQASGQPLAWHCCDERYPFIRDIVTTNEATIGAWRGSGIKFQPLYPLPSTGLPAPAPHAEVREATIEECAKIAEQRLGGYLCPYGRDVPGDPTWDHTDSDECPVCGGDGDESLHRCHDTVSGRIATQIRALTQQDRGGK